MFCLFVFFVFFVRLFYADRYRKTRLKPVCSDNLDWKRNFSLNLQTNKQTLKNDNFLYLHFKYKGHTPANILVQPVEKITYDANSTVDLN